MNPADRRRKTAIWLDSSCALALATVVANSVLAAEQPHVAVGVCVYNYAKVSNRVLGRARREASRIFAATEVDILWLDCLGPQVQNQSGLPPVEPAKGAEAERSRPAKDPAVGLRIISRPTAPRSGLGDEMFGFATGSDLASVFYQRVVDLAWGEDKDGNEIPLILGDVIAHELGHVLLGTNSHSPAGIMCANWNRQYLLLALRGHQRFSPEQSAVMRSAVVRRQHGITQP